MLDSNFISQTLDVCYNISHDISDYTFIDEIAEILVDFWNIDGKDDAR